ncbi:MAG TPA: hypothetical protein EYP21_05800 [Syntrophaceae bacterium]|nr:hypothetical protein [Syntrophaceae bacterium]
MEQLKLLVKLQNIDWRINEIAREKEKMPLKFEELHRSLETLEEDFKKVMENERHLQKKKRQIEMDLDEMSEQIKKSKSRLLEVKTNKEYRAMLKEIEEKERLTSDKEDEVLDILEEIEKLSSEIHKKRHAMEAIKKRHEKEKTKLEGKMVGLEKELAGLSIDRDSLVKHIDPKLVNRYNFIKQRRNGTAVVAVKDAICQACHMNIPPQVYNELQRGDQIMTCPNCQRIIYWGNHKDFVQEGQVLNPKSK